MEKGLEKRFGLLMAIAMVIGIVIGSGVFFKAEKVLTATGGDLPTGILAWGIGGLVMVICAYVFAIMATRYEKVNGVVDYAEVAVGETYGYYIGWFLAVMYYPALTSVLAWVSSRYFCVLVGWDIVGAQAMAIAGFLLVASYTVNALSPKLAGKFQVSTTIIKLVPLILMAIIGTVLGIRSGMLVENFSAAPVVEVAGNPLFAAIVATSFAYEGWIIATTINAELRDAKKNLPRALVFGTIFIVIVYILYYIGLAGTVSNGALMESGEAGAKIAFSTAFTNVGGTILFVFVVISCLGTLNGLMVGCTRGFYALAVRDMGPQSDTMKCIDNKTNMPTNASILGLFMAAVWLLYFYGANLTAPWFGKFCFDSSELPIITLYAMYIPIFIMMMKKEKGLNGFKRFLMPFLAICASLFMVAATIYAYRMTVAYYMVIYIAVMILGVIFKNSKHKKAKKA